MAELAKQDRERIDSATNLTVRLAIAEKLQQTSPQLTELPFKLEDLLARIRSQERESGR